ncbi:hypothetical protein OG401_21030 [Kitasatospora purpeofusca]|uniref:hypothetical protein n=1 Tax=Kitasatospora purpeofusca TaxID=67352 RepID=UPI0022592AB2|nr:hypothetical protein [Kitasatospora purpeofusca]MCX4686765.1 hypothetical protein [Kitasatospora purpeofusca]
MAALTVTAVPIAGGISLSDNLVAAAAGGDTAPTGPGRVLAVKNADASSHTVTLATPGTVNGLTVQDATVTVPAGKVSLIPLARVFAGASGRAALTYDAVTSLSVGVFELGT